MQLTDIIKPIAIDTASGLSLKNKQLSSKYFYDEKGSKIFQDIMRMPEYYLTDSEYEIFLKQAHRIIQMTNEANTPLELVELGAGDGIKTKLLIKELYRKNTAFRYIPIDISEEILFSMAGNLKNDFDGLDVDPKAGDYFDMMEEIGRLSDTPKLILFLGSNIGNYSFEDSIAFLKHIREIIHPQDKLLIGFDLKKDPQVIINAYNDPHGHTGRFNLNLLARLNTELNANFDLSNFKHAPFYDPEKGVAKSFIVSTENQSVYIAELDKHVEFKKWETIYTEQSQKYDADSIAELAKLSGFEVIKNFTDSNEYFYDSLWKPV